MLKVLERELTHTYYMLQRPVVLYNRKKNWPSKEPSGIKMVNEQVPIFGFTKNDVDITQNTASVSNFIDFSKSKGNYVVDADGNTMLDVAGTELNPLGYNHDLFKGAITGQDFDKGAINSVGADHVAAADYSNLVKSAFGPVAPKGLNGITLVSQQNATAAAVKAAMLEREADGFSALYFEGSTHGSPLTLGGMICGWPKASYPRSSSEESQILESVRNQVAEKRSSGGLVAAIVIEPTQQSTGYTASDEFMNGLRSIADDFEAALVVDETSTGCGSTGTFWQSNVSADYVAFGKRTQATGYYSAKEGVSPGGNDNDVKLFNLIYQGIQQERLLEKVSDLSSKMTHAAQNLKGFDGVRASGTSLWVDTADPAKLVAHMRSQGVIVKQTPTGIVAKPALIMGEPQANELINALNKFSA